MGRNEEDELLATREVCRLTRLTTTLLYTLEARGVLQPVRITGSPIRGWRKADVARALAWKASKRKGLVRKK